MTLEAWTPATAATIAGTGPYAIPHAYEAGALVIMVANSAGVLTVVDPADYTVTPAASTTTGTLTLGSTFATANAGRQLVIDRQTRREQGWAGVVAREKGIEAQLDRTMMALQEVDRRAAAVQQPTQAERLRVLAVDTAAGRAATTAGQVFATITAGIFRLWRRTAAAETLLVDNWAPAGMPRPWAAPAAAAVVAAAAALGVAAVPLQTVVGVANAASPHTVLNATLPALSTAGLDVIDDVGLPLRFTGQWQPPNTPIKLEFTLTELIRAWDAPGAGNALMHNASYATPIDGLELTGGTFRAEGNAGVNRGTMMRLKLTNSTIRHPRFHNWQQGAAAFVRGQDCLFEDFRGWTTDLGLESGVEAAFFRLSGGKRNRIVNCHGVAPNDIFVLACAVGTSDDADADPSWESIENTWIINPTGETTRGELVTIGVSRNPSEGPSATFAGHIWDSGVRFSDGQAARFGGVRVICDGVTADKTRVIDRVHIEGINSTFVPREGLPVAADGCQVKSAFAGQIGQLFLTAIDLGQIALRNAVTFDAEGAEIYVHNFSASGLRNCVEVLKDCTITWSGTIRLGVHGSTAAVTGETGEIEESRHVYKQEAGNSRFLSRPWLTGVSTPMVNGERRFFSGFRVKGGVLELPFGARIDKMANPVAPLDAQGTKAARVTSPGTIRFTRLLGTVDIMDIDGDGTQEYLPMHRPARPNGAAAASIAAGIAALSFFDENVIDTEAAAASDFLDGATLPGVLREGWTFPLRIASNGRSVTIRHMQAVGTGQVPFATPFGLSVQLASTAQVALAMWNGQALEIVGTTGTTLPAAGPMAAGSAGAPGFPVQGDADSGWFQRLPNTLSAALGGIEAVHLTPAGILAGPLVGSGKGAVGIAVPTRADALAWIAAAGTPAVGQVLRWGDFAVRYLGTGTKIADMPGWDAVAPRTPFHHGAVGDGTTDDRPAFAEMNSAGGQCYLPKPPTAYNVATAIDLNNVSVAVDPEATWAQLTDSGNISWTDEMGGWQFTGVVNTRSANIHRLADRVFVGSAADHYSGNTTTTPDGGTSFWSAAASGAAYLPINAQMLSIANHTPYAIVALSRGSDVNGDTPIGVGIGLISDVATKPGWGAIVEVIRDGGALAYGIEIGAKDKGGVFTTLNSYNSGAGVFGLWMAGGGDANNGGGAARPANSPFVILKNQQSGLPGGGWATGIVVTADALDGADGTAGSANSATALSLARRHNIDWGAPVVGALPTGSFGARITSTTDDAANAIQAWFTDNGLNLLDRSGNIFWRAEDGGNDYVANQSGTGQGILSARGASENVNVTATPKGSGNFNLTTGAYQIGGTQVMRARITGWGAPTGTATRTAFDTATVTTAQLAERVKALIDDFRTHGAIGT